MPSWLEEGGAAGSGCGLSPKMTNNHNTKYPVIRDENGSKMYASLKKKSLYFT